MPISEFVSEPQFALAAQGEASTSIFTEATSAQNPLLKQLHSLWDWDKSPRTLSESNWRQLRIPTRFHCLAASC